MKNRILAWLLLVCMLIGLLPMQALAAQVPSSLTEVSFDADSNEAVLNTDGAYKLSGSVTDKVIKVTNGANVTIVLEGVTMTAATSPIQVEAGATLTLIVRDGTENTITCTATTAGCSIATITGFDAYPFLKKGPPSVGGCFFLGCPFPCRLLPRRFRSQLFRSRLLFLGCPSLVGSSSGLGSSFLVGSDLSYSDLDGSSSDVLSSAAFTRGIAGAPVPVPVYSGRSPSNASPSSNSLVL